MQSNGIINDPYVKELIIKLDVLKKALLDERKKTQILEKKLNDLQQFANSKESEIQELCKEKHDLQSKLFLEKKKLENKDSNFKKITSFFSKNSNDSGKQEDYEEQITQLKFENEALQTRLNKALEQYENNKLQYKSLIQVQTQKIKTLEDTIVSLQKENNELKAKVGTGAESISKVQMEREHFEEVIRSLRREKEDAIDKMKQILSKFEELTLESESYKDCLHRHEIENAKLAQKLAEYKNMLIDMNTKVHIFHVTKVNSLMNKEIDITFGEASDGSIIMKVSYDKNEWFVNIEDVEYAKEIENGKIEIGYMRNSKKKKMIILINELIVEQFIQVYKDFFAKNMKKINGIL